MDLIYSNVLRRGAIRCGMLMNVAEIVRLFAGRTIPIDSPLLFSFEMYWFSPEGVRVFTALETPSVPDGSYVRVVERANRCSNLALPTIPDSQLVRWAEEAGASSPDDEAEPQGEPSVEEDMVGLLQRQATATVRDNIATLGDVAVDDLRRDGRSLRLRPPTSHCCTGWCLLIADMLRPPGNPPVFWMSTGFHDLDDWAIYHGAIFILDSKYTSKKKVLSLCACLPVQEV